MTRDSWVWTLGIIAAVLTAVANAADLFPPEWRPYINLAALVVGVVSGKLATSPLRGANDATRASASGAAKVVVPFLVAVTLLSACKPPASVQTEPGRQAWYASQVLQRVGEVQNVAIQLNATAPAILSTAQTKVIVQFCVSAAKTLKTVPDGWAKTTYAAYLEVKAQLPPAALANPNLQTALAVLEGLLVSFAGGQP